MSIRVRHWGLVICTTSVAFANDQYKEKFDKEQSARITSIQSIIATGDSAKARTQATEQIKSINERLEGHGTFGPHQRSATVQYGASLLTKEIVDHLENQTMYSGNKISVVSNYYFNENYGIEFKYVEAKGSEPAKWSAIMPTDTKKLKKYFETKMTEDAKKVWDSLSEVQRDDIARASVTQLATDLKEILPKDEEMSESMKAPLLSKSSELEKRLVDLNKELSTAHFLDEAEKRLLTAERKLAESLRDSKEGIDFAKFCEDLAEGLENPEDLNRRLKAMSATDPCRGPLESKQKGSEEGKALASSTEPASTGTYESKAETTANTEDKEHPENENGDDDGDDTEAEKEEKRKKLAEKGTTDKKLAEANKRAEALEAQVAAERQTALAAQGQAEQAMQALSMQQACQQPVNLPMSSVGSSQNQEQISELSTALGKKIADASVMMCENGTSPSKIINTMVPYGPLTAADQAKAESASGDFFEVAGNMAKHRPEYDQLMAMLREEASIAALERLKVENSSWINPAVIPHLKTLNKDELLAIDPSVGMSTLAKGATSLEAIAPLTNKYLENYNSALTKLKIKEKVNFDYDVRQQCSLDLARLSAARWNQEVSRSSSLGLMGPARQAAFDRSLATFGPKDIKNAPSSENKPKKVYRE